MPYDLLRLIDFERARDIESINRLLGQLSEEPKARNLHFMERFLANPDTIVRIVREGGKIVGMATLTIKHTLMESMGFVDDVVVDKNFRSRGYGRGLMERIIETAEANYLEHIDLTSNPNKPERLTAIAMYLSLGFKPVGNIGDSNYYRKDLI